MSFDSTFDYSNVLVFINDHIEGANVEIDIIDAKLSELGNIPGSLVYLVTPEIANQTYQKTQRELLRSTLQTLISEITTVTNLSNDDKTILFDFYTNAISEPVSQWMGRLLFNTSKLLSDAGNINGEILTTEQKHILGEYICNNIHIDASVYRYQLIQQFSQ
jgi:hypothetical protein